MHHETAVSCPPLAGTLRADVCVVGGGFVGLWSALEITERAPDATVVLLEAQGCGLGASGRNGGWATSWFDEIDVLVGRYGLRQGLWLADRSSAAIRRIGDFAAEHEIDCHFRQSGALWVATAPGQAGAWNGAVRALHDHGRHELVEPMDSDELRRRTGSPVLIGGVRLADSASIQPALLARGLRRVALARGVRIFEGTPMLALDRSRPAIVSTPAGRVEADAVILGLGAWSARIHELRRAVLPLGSQIVLTEPIPDRLERLGWTGGELLGDVRLMVHYAQVTRDGRVAFGRGGGAIGSFGRVVLRHYIDPRAAREVERDLRRWFPSLRDVRITHAWGGAVDRAPGHLPFIGTLGEHASVHYATGFSGNGVAPSVLAGRVLGRLALGEHDEYTSCGLVGGPPGYLPPEPLRSLGGAIVREGVRRAEASVESGRRPGRTDRLLERLVRFTLPRWLDPRGPR